MPPVAFQLPPQASATGNTASATAAQRLLRKSPIDRPAASSFNHQLTKITARSDQRAHAEAATKPERTEPAEKSARTDRTAKKTKAAESNRKSHQRDEEETSEVDEGTKADALPTTVDDLATTDGDVLAEGEAAVENADQPPADDAPVDQALLLMGMPAAATPVQNPTANPEVEGGALAGVSAEGADVGTLEGAIPEGGVMGTTAGGPATVTAEAATGETAGRQPGEKSATGVSGLGAKPVDHSRAPTAEIDESEAGQMTDGSADPGASSSPATLVDVSAVEQLAELFAPAGGDKTATPAKPLSEGANPSIAGVANGPTQTESSATQRSAAAFPPVEVPPDTEARFAATNHAKIVSDVRGALMPNGGSMQLKLDPPELGALQVSLHIKEGVVTASFQTQNPEAARLLSHTLGDLRSSLEAQGVTVDKLHVQQASKDEGAGNNNQGGDRQNQGLEQQQDSKREQQRKEMVQRLWDRLAGKAPIDLMA